MALVEVTRLDGVIRFELNDPPANAYSYEMMQELDRAVLDARLDSAAHVIVITGKGDKFFCAGANIEMLKKADPAFKYNFCLHANETLNRLEHTPKLTIAALNGHAVGGGLEIALACDLRVARRDGGKAGLPEVSLGVLPGTGGTQRLARLAGKSRAIELMATGRLMSFDEAAQMGLLNAVFESQGFAEKAIEYARQFCPPNKASKAVGMIKRAVQSGVESSFAEGLALERELQQQLFQSEDAREGLAAFVDKRPPKFKGK